VVASRAAGPVIGHELSELLAGEVLTKAAVRDGLPQAALDEGAVRVQSGDASWTGIRVVWAFAAIVSAERRFCVVRIHGVLTPQGRTSEFGGVKSENDQ